MSPIVVRALRACMAIDSRARDREQGVGTSFTGGATTTQISYSSNRDQYRCLAAALGVGHSSTTSSIWLSKVGLATEALDQSWTYR
jgi:hypothetical protein